MADDGDEVDPREREAASASAAMLLNAGGAPTANLVEFDDPFEVGVSHDNAPPPDDEFGAVSQEAGGSQDPSSASATGASPSPLAGLSAVVDDPDEAVTEPYDGSDSGDSGGVGGSGAPGAHSGSTSEEEPREAANFSEPPAAAKTAGAGDGGRTRNGGGGGGGDVGAGAAGGSHVAASGSTAAATDRSNPEANAGTSTAGGDQSRGARTVPPSTNPRAVAAVVAHGTARAEEEALRARRANDALHIAVADAISTEAVTATSAADDLHAPRTTFVDLTGSDLDSLSATVAAQTSLTKLILRGNRFTAVPAGLTALSFLEDLDLSENMVRDLVSSDGALLTLTNLSRLDVSSNDIDHIPEQISCLTGLTYLNVAGNVLAAIPDGLAGCIGLRTLVLGCYSPADETPLANQISALPDSISRLTALRDLELSFNLLTSLPEAVLALTNLTALRVYGNAIEVIPVDISRLACLESLNVAGNKLQTLPAEIGALTTLCSLCLGMEGFNGGGHLTNEIGALPATLTSLVNLTALDMSRCGEVAVHAPGRHVGADTVREVIQAVTGGAPPVLDLHGRDLDTFPMGVFDYTALTKLRLSDNHLRRLPDDISRLVSMRVLKVQGNELDAVPEALAACTSLCELWLGGFSGKEPAGNLLTSLPPALSSLTALEKLNLHFNSFEEFPMVVCELGASLRHLYLTSNVLISLPDDISRLSSLEQLAVDGNLISAVPESIGEMTALQQLLLGIAGYGGQYGNDISTLPHTITRLTRLTLLGLGGNPISVPAPLHYKGSELISSALEKLSTVLVLRGHLLESLPDSVFTRTALKNLTVSLNNLTSIPEEISSLCNLEILMAHGNEIEWIPDSLGACVNLRELWFGGFSGKEPAGNLISELPSTLSALTQIEKLNLHFCHFAEFPAVACEMATLKQLYLTSNSLNYLPADISRLENLEVFGVSGNHISLVPPSIAALTRLEELYLGSKAYGNDISHLPLSITRLTSLNVLALTSNPIATPAARRYQGHEAIEGAFQQVASVLDLHGLDLTRFPGAALNRTELTTLLLYDNSITEIPPEISRLSSLTALKVHKNNLTAIPAELGQCVRLRGLWLGTFLDRQPAGNQVSELPHTFSNLTDLISLLLHFNRFTEFPPVICESMHSVQQLYLTCNQITSLPEDISRLQELDTLGLAGNRLSSLPESIGTLTALTKLYVGDNGVQYNNFVSILPLSITRLTQLDVLDLRHNPITSPKAQRYDGRGAVAGALRTVAETLDLYAMHLKELPAFAVERIGLRTLDISRNMLAALPDDISNLVNLEVIMIQGNRLTAVTPAIGECRQLRELWLGGFAGKNPVGNKLSTLPDELSKLQLLERLCLHFNSLSEFPAVINTLVSLKDLYLTGNQIRALPPSISLLTCLEWLEVSQNPLRVLPREIGAVVSLTALGLGADNALTSIPVTLTRLTNLTELDLRDSRSIKVPSPKRYEGRPAIDSAFRRISKASRTRVAAEPAGVSAAIDKVAHTEKATLDLSQSGIDMIPHRVYALWSLTKLNLRSNDLYDIPPDISRLTSLKTLLLNGNSLWELPTALTAISALRVLVVGETKFGGNDIRRLAPEFAAMTGLERLSLAMNHFSEFPLAICGMASLRRLIFNDNQLEEIPAAISRLTALEVLVVDDNALTSLPPGLVACTALRTLRFQNNFVTALPPEFLTLEGLKAIDASGNPLEAPEPREYNSPEDVAAAMAQLRASFGDSFDWEELEGEVADLVEEQHQVGAPDEDAPAGDAAGDSAAAGDNDGRPAAGSSDQVTAAIEKAIADAAAAAEAQAALEALELMTFEVGPDGELNISDKNLKAVPPQLCDLTELVSLDLSLNPIEDLPDAMTRLSQLTALRTGGNLFNEFPSAIVAMTQLRLLEIGSALVPSIPPEVSRLTNLECMLLLVHEVHELPPEIGACTALTTLHVTSYKASRLPSTMSALTNLRTLSVHFNALSEFPEVICNLSLLRDLLIRGDNLRVLPSSVSRLSSLAVLDLSGSQLESLPDTIGELTNLQCLLLGRSDELGTWGNAITALPSSITQLTRLQLLDITANPIESPPPACYINDEVQGALRMARAAVADQAIEHVLESKGASLDLAENEMGEVPPAVLGAVWLKTLNLRANNLSELPDDISRLTKLKTVLLGGNALTELPPSICALKALRSLDLGEQHYGGNQVAALPADLSRLGRLDRLSLGFNAFTEFPVEVCGMSRLKRLLLSSNKISSLPEAFSVLTSMEVLALDENAFQAFPEVVMTLPVLRTLRLQGNEVATLPLGVTAMYALNVLDLRANPLTTVLPDEYTDKDGIERLIQAVKDAYGVVPEVVPKRRKASKKKDPPAAVVQVESVDDVDQGAPSTAAATARVATTSEATGGSDPVEAPSDADVATTPAEEVAATPAASSNRDGNRADRAADAGPASQDQEPTPTAAPGGNDGPSQRGSGKGNRNRSGGGTSAKGKGKGKAPPSKGNDTKGNKANKTGNNNNNNNNNNKSNSRKGNTTKSDRTTGDQPRSPKKAGEGGKPAASPSKTTSPKRGTNKDSDAKGAGGNRSNKGANKAGGGKGEGGKKNAPGPRTPQQRQGGGRRLPGGGKGPNGEAALSPFMEPHADLVGLTLAALDYDSDEDALDGSGRSDAGGLNPHTPAFVPGDGGAPGSAKVLGRAAVVGTQPPPIGVCMVHWLGGRCARSDCPFPHVTPDEYEDARAEGGPLPGAGRFGAPGGGSSGQHGAVGSGRFGGGGGGSGGGTLVPPPAGVCVLYWNSGQCLFPNCRLKHVTPTEAAYGAVSSEGTSRHNSLFQGNLRDGASGGGSKAGNGGNGGGSPARRSLDRSLAETRTGTAQLVSVSAPGNGKRLAGAALRFDMEEIAEAVGHVPSAGSSPVPSQGVLLGVRVSVVAVKNDPRRGGGGSSGGGRRGRRGGRKGGSGGVDNESGLTSDLETRVLLRSLVQHRNIVQFMGYAVDGTTAVIVNDQMEWGSLADRLSVFTGRAALSWRARVGVARDAARGLLFLHRALSVPISHGLVHCGSVFLTANAEARLGDFSRASLLASASSNEVMGLLADDVLGLGLVMVSLLAGTVCDKSQLPTVSGGGGGSGGSGGGSGTADSESDSENTSGVVGEFIELVGADRLTDLPAFLDAVVRLTDEDATMVTQFADVARRCIDGRASGRPAMADLLPALDMLWEDGGLGGGGGGGGGVALGPDNIDCAVCQRRQVTVAASPCGHRCMCEACAAMVMSSSRRCPVCDGVMLAILTVFR